VTVMNSLFLVGVPQSILNLQSGWTNMFHTETVTLRCDVQGSPTPWVYKWYRDGQEIPISGDGDTYTIPSAARSHSGQYECRGELPERAVTSPHSNSLLLTVYETPPKLQIPMETPSEDIYTGERLTLTCTVDGDSTGWKYLWYKDTQRTELSNIENDRTDGSSYTISSAAPEYRCRGNRTENAQVVLTADPPWSDAFPGDNVTLTCQVTGSEGWMFLWSRVRNGETSQLQGYSDQGQYQCTGRRGNEVLLSNFHNLTVSSDRPQAAVIQTPPGPLWFTGETVILTCDIRRTSGKWRYSWAMKNKQGALESLTPKSKEEQQTHTIQPVTESHSGEYLCQGERGKERVIQSLPGSVVLKVSGKLTLTCTVDGDSTGWKYLWYKDTQGVVLSNTDSDRTDGSSYTINSAAPSHSGQYWCRAHRGGFYSHYSDSHEVNIQGEDLKNNLPKMF
uniref:Ig-like domain-containing protein n=1 Tax=Scleropages formosus TaxID=113540 RepID=A0A8C9SQ26_SCLFO